MCRSIKTLRRAETAATTGEIEAAARQFVRKVSGYREPSARNREAFDAAIVEIAVVVAHAARVDLGVAVEDRPEPLERRTRPRRRVTTTLGAPGGSGPGSTRVTAG